RHTRFSRDWSSDVCSSDLVGMTLEKAYEQEEILRDFIKVDEEAAEIWEMARKLEGVVRIVGKHAGGVVFAPTKLTDFSPIYCDRSEERRVGKECRTQRLRY